MSADQVAFVEPDRDIGSGERARRLDALSELVARFAHDFNNVLATITLNLTLIEKRCADPTALWFAASALRAADRGTDLAQRLLAFAGKQTIAPAPADLNSLLARIRSPLLKTAGPKVELILRASEDLWPVSIDADQIEFALVQVASNARDAMPEGGQLSVETSNARVTAATADLAAGDYVALSIEDTGEGCSEAALERAFEPFFSTKTDQAHLGLGLSVVLGIAKQHGGTARVLPSSGGGCRVEIFLPRASEAEISASRSQESAPQARQVAKSTVLVVDDDPDLRAVARDGLEILGCDVLLADGGPEALEILKSHGPVDLLMVDIRMGGMDGLELIQRARGIWPGLKALVMTGGADVPEDLGNGAMRVLKKPFRVDDLAQEIAALLSRDGPASQ